MCKVKQIKNLYFRVFWNL